MNETGFVDLRSDTVTKPTPAMRVAMAAAEVGDDLYGEDPTVNALQDRAAALLGKDAALYVPSGTMANQLALRVLGRPGTEVLCARGAHVREHEAAAAAMNAGMQVRAIAAGGVFGAADVEHAAAGVSCHLPPVSTVWVENTHMPSSGRLWPPATLAAVGAAARAAGLHSHCDGARIFNVVVASGVAAADLVAPFDTAMFCLSKGLGAPVGSVLVGPADAIAEAREQRSRLGGGMRQAGVIAAAGLVALDTMIDRLADDHDRARRLAARLAELFPDSLDPADVCTNIVCCPLSAFPPDLLDRLHAHGVLAGVIDQATVRFVLHNDVDDAGLDLAFKAFGRIA